MTISLSSLLTSAITTGTQNQSQLELSAIGNTLTNRLNTKIAQLKADATDAASNNAVQGQITSLNQKNENYSKALPALGKNAEAISDIKIQVGNLATAAAAGDSASFDQALAATATDIQNLQSVPQLSGFQLDGVSILKSKGLGVQSSATYDLSTPAGQAQASADVQAASTLVNQVYGATSQNQAIANSVSQALTGHIDQLNSQISNQQTNALISAQTQISTLQTQEQTEFHLIELESGSTTNASSVLTTASTSLATSLAAMPGATKNSTDPNVNNSVFFSVLETNTGIANQEAATSSQGATAQPTGAISEQNSVRSAATGALLTLFA
jgi:hypothetical protein